MCARPAKVRRTKRKTGASRLPSPEAETCRIGAESPVARDHDAGDQMSGNKLRGRLLATSVMGGMALFAAQPALGQTSSATEATEVGEIVITGSRIRRAETTTDAPVAVIDAQVIAERGFVQAGQALNELTANMPQFALASGSG